MFDNIRKLLRQDSGSVAVEFALIGPAFIAMFMGVLQIGIGMQNYNALRGVSGDVARYAVVNYQTGNKLATTQLQSYAQSVATQPPYGLISSRFQVSVTMPDTQRVAGATEYSMKITYDVPSFLSVIGLGEIPITYTRPIFVLS